MAVYHHSQNMLSIPWEMVHFTVLQTLSNLYSAMTTCAKTWTIWEVLHQDFKFVFPVECWCITFCPMTNWCCCHFLIPEIMCNFLMSLMFIIYFFKRIYSPSMKNAMLMMNSTSRLIVKKLCARCKNFQPISIKRRGFDKWKNNNLYASCSCTCRLSIHENQ